MFPGASGDYERRLKGRPWALFANLFDQYHITYDNAVEENVIIHTENGTVKFGRGEEGLYTYRLPKDYKEAVVEENKKRKQYSKFLALAENDLMKNQWQTVYVLPT